MLPKEEQKKRMCELLDLQKNKVDGCQSYDVSEIKTQLKLKI